ncbi:glycosyltransferase family 1 protein [Jeotgalibacillus soli]|uniref:Glycosyl transferase family 1 n=1 Tax=Jeotgalibacillus soli TaxID=889306 RepID=A0A0C2VZG4_9BACL|nr:glycosyltransferase family 1 protein [Jeotgalibacillus soli]KIL49348.1 glycosyl transferase family 1 [Jeotgalibacillus soli]
MGNPLRVLHAVVNMNRGGAETLIMNLYRNVDRSKIQFDFLTCKEGIFDKEILEMGGRIHRIPYVTEIGHTAYVKKLNHFFQKHSTYQIIHSHMDKMSGLVLQAAKKAAIPVRIAHSHNTQSEGGLAQKLYKWYVGNKINLSATHLYACSDAAAKWLFNERSKETYVLKNGIECEKYQFSLDVRSRVRNELRLGSESLVIGHIGRFNHQKNHLFLLEVFMDLLKVVPHAILVLAGDGKLRTKIEEKIKEYELEDHVKLLGVREDIHMLLQAFDLFVFPSLHEGLPVTLIEAQGSGLPCIISNSITKEADMGAGLVQYLSLDDKSVWIEAIYNTVLKKSPREIAESALDQNGYNIRKTAEFTQISYLALGGRLFEDVNGLHPNL